MHECPECEQVCCCDQEDTWNEVASRYCDHNCDESGRGDDDDFDDGDDRDYPPYGLPSQESKE
jgi:hypothetical protein